MADLPLHSASSGDAGDDASAGPERGATTLYPGTPRWVKGVGIVLLVLVLLVVGMLVAGVGGSHGPVRHLPSGGADTTPSAATAAGLRPGEPNRGWPRRC